MNSISRCFCTAIGEIAAEAKASYSHMFNRNLFNNLQELSSHLQKNIIYNKNGLLLLNKPYGLKKEGPRDRGFWQKKVQVAKSPSVEQIDHLSFCDVIPYLSKELNVPNLELIKVPERFISGISILCNNELWKRKISRNFGNTVEPLSTYLAICIGIPIKLSDHVKLGLTLKEHNNNKKTTFLTNYSVRSVLRQKVVPVTMSHQTLSFNETLNVSLVQIRNSRNKWNALKAYCAQRLLSPVLGDMIFGSCVKTINKKAVLIDLINPIANFPPKIASNILSQLELQKREANIIPVHLHLTQINWAKFKSDGHVGRTFIAKPPDHFLWTCEKLNLTVPDCYLRNYDTVLDEWVLKECNNETEKVSTEKKNENNSYLW